MIKTINFIFEINGEYYRIDGFNVFNLTVCLEQINYKYVVPYEAIMNVQSEYSGKQIEQTELKFDINEIEYTENYKSVNLINLSIRFLKALWAYFKVDRQLKTTKELITEGFDFEEDF